MVEDIKVLSCRRSYEFGIDDVRLNTLSTSIVQEIVRTAFNFQAIAAGTVPPTFAPAREGAVPGLIFQTGLFADEDGQAIPIRMVIIEQRRIVVDAAVTPDTFDRIFAHLKRVLSEAPISTPQALIGEPVRTLDYSELSAKFAFAPVELIAPSLRDVLGRSLAALQPSGGVLLPTLSLQVYDPESEYPGLEAPTSVLAIRAATRPSEGIYFSGAYLNVDDHRKYLSDVAAAFDNPS